MFNYRPARVILSQAAPTPTGPAPVPSVPAPMPVSVAPAPVPVNVVAYQGVPGVLEVVSVLAIAGTAAYVGIDSAMKTRGSKRIASWVGGVGSALLGLLYLGTRTGLGQKVGLPMVSVSPAA